MGREKILGKGKEIQAFQSFDDENQLFERRVNPKRTKPQAVPNCARGRGRPTQKLSSNAPGRGVRTKRASTGDVEGRYDDNIDLSPFELVVVPIKPPTCARNDPSPLDFNARDNNIKPLRFQDPSKLNKTFHGDSRFWQSYQADWYETVILTKNRITMEMKWVNWNYLKSIPAPCKEVLDVVYDRFREMGLLNIMNFSCDGMKRPWLNFMPLSMWMIKGISCISLLEEKGSLSRCMSLPLFFTLVGLRRSSIKVVASWRLIVILFVYTMATNLK
jgi:hypothetical protein